MSKYGHFSASGSEYIITNPHTPSPWINFLTNQNYCALVSATGGGYSFVGDTKYNRLTREIPGEQVREDRPGRYLFIRDMVTGKFWTPNWQPVMGKVEKWQATQGLGFTRINSLNHDIDTEIEYFVPLDDTLEIWKIKITNLDRKARELGIFTYVEWALGFFGSDLNDRNFQSLFNKVYFQDNIIFATKTRTDRPDKPGLPWEKWAFLSGDVVFDGWDCSRRAFLGGDNFLNRPEVIYTGKTRNTNAIGEDAVGVINKNIALKPGQSFRMNILLGASDNLASIRRLVKKYSLRKTVLGEYHRVRASWKEFSSRLQVVTPDHNLDISLNFWSKYQAWVASVWGESDSLYISASDIGFRDECQHIYGILPVDLDLAKKILIELLSNQYSAGFVNHNWNRTTRTGVVTHHSDDCQWLVMALINYVEETGDVGFLSEKVAFYDSGKSSVLDHLLRAMDYTLYHVAPSGIPLRRTADWNDAMAGGHLGRGESLMVACQVCWNITRLVPLLDEIISFQERFGLKTSTIKTLIDRYQHVYQRIKDTLNHDFWDGEWFVRATDDNGREIGSKNSKEGKIHLDAQTWAVMSGVADETRGLRAMDSVWRHLDTPYGPCIFLPSYTHASSALGIISQFAPGSKENGTIFSHLVAWSIISECILGRGDKAYEIWKKSSFTYRGEDPDIYRVEPYVYSEFTYGPENHNFGQGSYSWMTGSAAWFLRACTDWILGVRPTLGGIFIDPCIPKNWKSYKMKRVFRGVIYDIEVFNPDGVNKGVRKIEVNGRPIKGSLIALKHHGPVDVKVEMG